MTKHLVISGIGLITPLGATAQETWRALLAGEAISTHSHAKFSIDPAESRIHELAARVAQEALTDAGWRDASNTAILVGTSKGPVESWIDSLEDLRSGGAVKNYHGVALGLSDIAAHVAHKLSIPDAPRLTLSGACASGLHALVRAAMMLRTHEISRAIVIAVESSLNPLFIASFHRLGVLPPVGVPCRPFDELRSGFLMSEAAAAVCLELKPPAAGDISIDRYAIAADATHLTGADPEAKTVRHLLKTICPTQSTDLIHAHGTATESNDPIELAAIESVIARTKPPPILYSHKGALGHSLGAAGLVSLALNVLAHRESTVPGNIRTTKPIPMTCVRLSQKPITMPIHQSVTLASGFGGSLAGISLKSA